VIFKIICSSLLSQLVVVMEITISHGYGQGGYRLSLNNATYLRNGCKMYREVLNAVILGFFNNSSPLKCSENERRNDILVVYSFTLSSEAEFMNVQFR
jgi:hypothetical protein